MEQKKSKVMVVGAFPPPGVELFGGVLTTCKALLDSTFAQSFDLVLIDSTQVSNPPPKFWLRALLAAKRFGRFVWALIKARPDAVLLFTSDGASIIEKGAMAWVCRLAGRPCFMFPRTAQIIETVQRSALRKFWVKLAMRGADQVLCQGPGFEDFARHILGFTADRTLVIENWSATGPLLEIGRQRNASSTGKTTFLFLAWLEKSKGIFELLQAVKDLSGQHDLRLVVAGRGHAEEQAQAFVRAHGLQEQVQFVGWVQGEAKLALLRQSDILVLPSWVEGFPNAVIEAMAAKLAVIVTTVGTVPDLLTDRHEALLIPPKNTQALQTAMDELLRDIRLRNDLAERGHTFAQDRFAVERGAEKLTQAIAKAIAKQ
jgi:glycosyltransferase involved in cell wall biosynthesis